ncbi:hypothetical protein Tco_0687306 [Tanacetum coccineum]
MLGCAETKVATWDDLAFKLIILGWNVKHSILQNVDPSWIEYAVLDRELDTPYPVEVDTPYSTVDQNSGLKQWSGSQLNTAYWGFLEVGTTLDIFQNIKLIPYLEYDVLSPLDTAY